VAPGWLSAVFAGVMLAVALSCAGRLIAAGVRRRESELDADSVHLLMGAAMAGALAPPLSFLPARAWEIVFALAAAWFTGQLGRRWRGHGTGRWRCPHPGPHLAESVTMVYMLAAAPAAGGRATAAAMPGMGGSPAMTASPVVAVLLALFMVGYVAWLGDRLRSAAPAAAAAIRPGPAGATAAGTAAASHHWPVLAPRAAACSKIAMGITMAYMLITML
jgi:Domain of unknown function (DUF5134)